jgi:hypothetical protein
MTAPWVLTVILLGSWVAGMFLIIWLLDRKRGGRK